MRTNVLGRLETFELRGRTLERVTLRSDDLAKRILRLSTSAGDIGLRFEGTQRLRDGDVVFADEQRVIAVRVDADDVLVIRPATIDSAIRVAHALGNRHLPIQTDAGAIVVRYDPLLEALAHEHGVAITREQRIVREPFRHARAPHRHD